MPTISMDDAQLWQQLKSGDKNALEEIFRKESDALCKYVRNLPLTRILSQIVFKTFLLKFGEQKKPSV
jgi:hypothetical protein